MIFDHVDLRVSDVGRVRTFYDAFLRPFGFRGRPQDDGTLLYFRLEKRHVREAIAVIPDPQHRPNLTRLAFCAPRPPKTAVRSGAAIYGAPTTQTSGTGNPLKAHASALV